MGKNTRNILCLIIFNNFHSDHTTVATTTKICTIGGFSVARASTFHATDKPAYSLKLTCFIHVSTAYYKKSAAATSIFRAGGEEQFSAILDIWRSSNNWRPGR